MLVRRPNFAQRARPWLVLGRVSNLPTVWSNGLAGWLLGGRGGFGALLLVWLGTTFLYLGGMWLNDYCDVEFDRRHRPGRPIPAGQVTRQFVFYGGLLWLAAGVLTLVALADANVFWTLLLVALIVTYDVVHKMTAISPLLMAACRFCVYLIAASVGDDGIGGLAVWSAFALAAYIVGLTQIARKEHTQDRPDWWPLLLLLTPIGLALLANAGAYREVAIVLCLLFVVSVLVALRHAVRDSGPNIGMTVSSLLAVIVFVDLLAVAGDPPGVVPAFLGLFLLAKLAQRYVPAT
jgi:4-hydroxybenzoate polyprenyltransferase